MEIKDYPSNTLKDRAKANNTVTPVTTEKKVDKVVTGKVVTKKKNGFEKFFTSMIENDSDRCIMIDGWRHRRCQL